MGIYDREYVRVGPRSPQGLGRLRFLSFNTWLIIINVAVFVLDALLFSSGVAVNVSMGERYFEGVTRDQVTNGRVVHYETGGPNRATASAIIDSRGAQVPRRPAAVAEVSANGRPALFIDGQVYEIIGVRQQQPMGPFAAWLHFSTAKFFQLEVWRLIGFQFLHDQGNISHILFNMLGLFFFGGLVEGYLGPRRYAAFYLVCGIFGALTYLLLNLIANVLPAGYNVPGLLFNDIHTPLIGASAGVFGVLMAAAFVAPNANVLLFFVIPMKLSTLAYVLTAVAFFVVLTGGSNAGGQAAHIGGALAGFYFIRHTHLLRDFFDILGPRKAKGAAKAARGDRAAPDNAEIDRILAKVSMQGLHSLTEAERRTLRRASESKK